MDITPIIPDGYNGPIKQLTCRICKRLFYITQDDYRRLSEVRYCHECSLILLEELQNNQGAAALLSPSVAKTEPVASVPPRLSLQPSSPVHLPAPRTLDREKMTVEQVLDEARMFEKTWSYRKALRSYEEALLRDPRCIVALYGRASMLSILDHPRETLIVYEELLHLEPASAKILSRKGWILGSLKRYEEAFTAFDTALQLDPSCGEASTGKWFFLTHLDRDEEAKLLRESKKSTSRHEDVTGPCSTADDYYQRGLALSALGRDEEAIRAYEECLRLDPLHLDVYERIHFMHLSKGRHEQSLATFTRAVQAFPECTKLHIYYAEALGQLKRYQEASEACQRAIQLDGAYAEAYAEKSRHLAHLKRYAEALEAIEQAIVLNPDADHYYRQKANALASLRRDDEALATYDQAIDLDPDHFSSYREKAELLAQLRRDEDALVTYDRFIERNPLIFEGYRWKLYFLSKRKRYTDGLATCDRCLAYNPHQVQAHEQKGRMFSSLHRYEEALLSFEEAIHLHPQGEDIYTVKAETLTLLKRDDEALSTFDQALQLAPHEVSIYKKKGDLLITLKRYEEALASLKSAARLDAKDAALQDKIGDVLSELERFEEAVNTYDRAIRLDRGFIHAYRSKAAALEKLEQQQEAFVAYGEALVAYDKALKSEPKDFFLHFFRADILIHLERYDEANATYDQAEHLAPHPFMAVHCIFARGNIRMRAEAKARLQAASKEISEKTIAAEVELMHKEKKLEPLRASPLFVPICKLMQEQQEWSGTAKQFKDVLCHHHSDALATWYRAPRKFVDELQTLVPALHEEGIEVSTPPDTTLVTLVKEPIETP